MRGRTIDLELLISKISRILEISRRKLLLYDEQRNKEVKGLYSPENYYSNRVGNDKNIIAFTEIQVIRIQNMEKEKFMAMITLRSLLNDARISVNIGSIRTHSKVSIQYFVD
jgi:hypothetical protein